MLRAVVSRPAVWFGLGWRGLWRAGVGVCVGASRSVVVVHLSMWLGLAVELASGMSWGLHWCYRRTRRRGERAARVVLSARCLAWCTGVFE